MITGPKETEDAVVDFVMKTPERAVTCHELAGLLVALEKNVRPVLEDLALHHYLVKEGEAYRRTPPTHPVRVFESAVLALMETPLTPEEEKLLPVASVEVGTLSTQEAAHALLVALRKRGGEP